MTAAAPSTDTSRPQIGHDFWGIKEGAPDEIWALAQTSDGYLWLGGSHGLVRFDGLRFERFRPRPNAELVSNSVSNLFAPSKGGLWIGYRFGGFGFLDKGRISNFITEPPSTGTVFGFAQDPAGTVWAGTSSGVWRFDGPEWEHLGAEWNAPQHAEEIGFDRSGWLWVVSGGTLLFRRPGSHRFDEATDLSAVGFGEAGGLTWDADGFVVTTRSWKPLAPPTGTAPSAYPLLKNSTLQIIDRAGGLWISFRSTAHIWPAGSLDDALGRASLETEKPSSSGRAARWIVVPGDPSRVENFDFSAYPSAQMVDREGNTWFGTAQGLHRLYYKPFVQPDLPDLMGQVAIGSDGEGGAWVGGQSSPVYRLAVGQESSRILAGWFVNFFYRAPDGTQWISARTSGLWHDAKPGRYPGGDSSKWSDDLATLRERTGREWSKLDLPPQLAESAPYLQAMAQDQLGGLWVSLGGHGLYRVVKGAWTLVGGREDLPAKGVMSMYADELGRFWFGYAFNRVAFLEKDRVRVLGADDGLRVGNVLAFAGSGPHMWIGGEFGLQRFGEGGLQTIEAVDDEMLRGISGIIERANGDLWLNGLSGIVHIEHKEIAKRLEDPSHRVAGARFGPRDGLPGTATQLRPLPSAVEGTDGRLWFALSNGVVWLDPDRASDTTAAVPITIQSVLADDRYYEPGAPMRFPAHTSTVRVDYVAVSLSAPQAVRYRYKLLEEDRDWQEARVALPVTYRNLAPGNYHFEVNASDTNGAWSDRLATVEFTLLPAFYQTTWFLALCVLATAGTVYAAVRLRVGWATSRVRAQMEARLSERERIARELHDTLLQSVQGLILKFQALANGMPRDEPTRRSIETTLDHADRVVAEGRGRVRDLRGSPLLIGDLRSALHGLVEERQIGQVAEFKAVADGEVRDLDPMVLEESYAIGREALLNALAHSGGAHIQADIHYGSKQFGLRVRDDGRGIDTAVLDQGGRDDHWGLQGMRERAQKIGGRLEIRSRPEGGTEVELIVPASSAYRSVRARRTRRLLPWKTEG